MSEAGSEGRKLAGRDAGARPKAWASIEPQGARTQAVRDHLIKVTLDPRAAADELAGPGEILRAARRALAAFAPTDGKPDTRRFDEVPLKAGKATLVGVEVSVSWPGRPSDAAIHDLRAALTAGGYRVTVRETRECTEPGCTSDASVEWNRPLQIPRDWYSSLVCGKHDYKTCARCQTKYLMSSTNSMVQAPSLSCEVCGAVIIEWGGTKLWSAQLVTRGIAPESDKPDR